MTSPYLEQPCRTLAEVEATRAPTIATHTPGPWRLELWSYENGKRVAPTIQTDKDAVAQILDLWCPDEREAERDANARLIAAAPDMLWALLEMRRVMLAPGFKSIHPTKEPWAVADAFDLMQEAIAKAQGR